MDIYSLTVKTILTTTINCLVYNASRKKTRNLAIANRSRVSRAQDIFNKEETFATPSVAAAMRRGCRYSPRWPLHGAAAANTKCTGDSYSRKGNICDTLGAPLHGRCDMTDNREIYIPHLYPTLPRPVASLLIKGDRFPQILDLSSA